MAHPADRGPALDPMSRRVAIRAAGAVVLRGTGDDVEVLMIHRPAYDDWSLPKGKGTVDELAPQTAVREVFEEAGVAVRLGLRLPPIEYKLSKGLKAVQYWRAEVLAEHPFEPNREVDKIRWARIDRAMRTLTYADERRLLSTALLKPRTTPLLLVRHGKAMLRKDWSGPDQERRLTGRGRRQARELAQLFGAYGVEHLVSSSSTRCVETLRPYAEQRGLEIVTEDVLTEEEGTVHPREVRRFVARLFKRTTAPTALCGHRPVLPAMFEGLGIKAKPMVVGEVVVVHRDDDGDLVAVEVHKPTA
ncbi:NUDIX hydrolase [Tessaracoccus sp. MC1756]|uniref:NUDIX hydrolase n=1 Tax=Tessaracoccus sp. MC1756 TaxID=2760311 RepID=UPI001603131E|nr:NUDIX hydrolase [Tessaracoccus sp. MC1756]MBB1508519.1 NUDIX hydrolase [Tessaracoccus sp. MC1756]